MKVLLAAVLGTALFAQPLWCAKAKITRESIETGGFKRSFYLFVPSLPPPAGGYPLLVLLHGSGRDGSSLVERWKDLAGKEGIVLAGPSSANSAYWNALHGRPRLSARHHRALKSDYSINARRVYLFGHSAGAVFTIAMAGWEPEYFAAAALHAGAFRSPDEVQVANDMKRPIPLAMYSGTDDPFFPIRDVRATAEILRKLGVRVSLTELPHHDHNYYVISSKLNETIWTFLKENELPAEPRFVRRNFVPGR